MNNPSRNARLLQSRERGFSLVELLIAAAILAIGILGLAALQSMAIEANTGSRSLTSAVQIAERTMDEIETRGRNSLTYVRSAKPSAAEPTDVAVFGVAVRTKTFNFQGLERPAPFNDVAYYTVTSQRVEADPANVTPVAGLGGLAAMRVVVTWQEKAGRTRSVTLNRRIAYATS